LRYSFDKFVNITTTCVYVYSKSPSVEPDEAAAQCACASHFRRRAALQERRWWRVSVCRSVWATSGGRTGH